MPWVACCAGVRIRIPNTWCKDVGLSIRRGESIAVIGENGAGKSTLLKLITGVLTPTTGSVQVFGKVGALLELGAGFHPEYSGRDNIAMAAALYGLSRADLDSRMDEIIAFADIGDYIEEPVKHYSSGMVVRLGFAMIASLKPDLLITDEVLAVGDESFQKKCVRWMEEYLANGGTLLLVSHSMYHVQKLCRHALWLSHGVVMQYGDVFDVTQGYLAWHERKQSASEKPASKAPGLEFGIESFEVNGQDGNLRDRPFDWRNAGIALAHPFARRTCADRPFRNHARRRNAGVRNQLGNGCGSAGSRLERMPTLPRSSLPISISCLAATIFWGTRWTPRAYACSIPRNAA